MFFKYVFSENYDAIYPTSIKIFDKNFNEIPENKYKIELVYNYNEDTGVKTTPSHYEIYNDLQSTYNELTGDFNVFFLQYTKISNNTNITILLNNEPLYQEATISDYWTLTSEIAPWKHIYELSVNNGLSIKMSKDEPTYIRYIDNKRIKLNQPVSLTNTESWNLRVTNGNFNSSYGPYNLLYQIKEFSDQSFNPFEPYKLSSRVTCKTISKNLIKLPNEKINISGLFSYIDIIISDKDGVEKYAITNNPDKENEDYINFDNERIYIDGLPLKWETSLFLSLDEYNGIVHVDVNLLNNYIINASYTYIEDTYVIKNLNMNPIFDINANNEIKVVYLIPSNSPTNNSPSSQTKSVNFLKINRSGKILFTSQDGTNGNPKLNRDTKLSNTDGISLDGIINLHYGWSAETTSSSLQEITYNNKIYVSSTDNFPKSGWIRFVDNSTDSVSGLGITRYAKYTKKTNDYFLLSNETLEVPELTTGLFISENTKIELVNFIEERTTNSTRVYDDEMNHRISASIVPVHCSRYFILGEISINAPHKITDSILLDVRQNGGGIKEDKYIEAKNKNEKVTWINDKNTTNGQLYPGNAVIVIELPVAFKEKFSESQIKDIIEENIPFGIMPVIEYYGYQPDIISVLPL